MTKFELSTFNHPSDATRHQWRVIAVEDTLEAAKAYVTLGGNGWKDHNDDLVIGDTFADGIGCQYYEYRIRRIGDTEEFVVRLTRADAIAINNFWSYGATRGNHSWTKEGGEGTGPVPGLLTRYIADMSEANRKIMDAHYKMPKN